MNGTKITATWEDLNDGAAELVTEVLQGLVHAVHSGIVRIEPGHVYQPSPAAEHWNTPAFVEVYRALAISDLQRPGNALVNWLNANGFANLTCCPECHVDDFTHIEGCQTGSAVEMAAGALLRFRRERTL